MATCAKVIDEEQAKSPNLVKVVLDSQNNALYFSRPLSPFYEILMRNAKPPFRAYRYLWLPQ